MVSMLVVAVTGLVLMVRVRFETAEWLVLAGGLIVLTLSLLLVTYWTEKTLDSELGEIGRGLEKMVVGNDIDRMPQPKLPELKGLAENLDTVAGRVRRNIILLESEREKFKAVLDNIDTGVILFGQNGKAELVNRVACSLLGVDTGLVSGRTMIEINPSSGLVEAYESAESGGNADMEVEIVTPERKLLQVVSGPVITDDGDTRGTIVVLKDITATRHLETVRKDFVANVSHELRTPVANLRAVVDALIAGGMEDDEVARKFIENIDRESSRLMRIIEDLLVLSRIERDLFSISDESVAINRLLDEVILEERDHAGMYDVEIVYGESGSEDGVISGDARLLKTALINLFDNAIKYNKPGGRVIAVIKTKDDFAEVSVADTGVGIPSKDLDRIFERFYRVDRARSRETGGTGLGLSIVKHIVDLHGGRITVKSVEGEGSRFILTFPLGRKEPA